ncbi:MAG TPA: hypothetical protein VGK06_15450 [Methanosarcina sp.]|jgi:hypothetical protein
MGTIVILSQKYLKVVNLKVLEVTTEGEQFRPATMYPMLHTIERTKSKDI